MPLGGFNNIHNEHWLVAKEAPFRIIRAIVCHEFLGRQIGEVSH